MDQQVRLGYAERRYSRPCTHCEAPIAPLDDARLYDRRWVHQGCYKAFTGSIRGRKSAEVKKARALLAELDARQNSVT